MVDQGFFVKIKVSCRVATAGIGHPDLTSQLEHVVRIAALCRVLVQVRRDLVRRPEVLSLAVPADGVGMCCHCEVPGIARDVQILRGSCAGVRLDRTDPLWYL